MLIERGSKLVGETRGEVHQGAARMFVLWTEARTPTGVIVPLASPGTDELGRSGLPGEVNRHFFQRFGAAILISVIDGAVQSSGAVARAGRRRDYNPSASQDVMTEVLKSTVNIPPDRHQGPRRSHSGLRRPRSWISGPSMSSRSAEPAEGSPLRGRAPPRWISTCARCGRSYRASEVTELCINRPGVAFLETREGWQREAIPFADFDWCRRLAKLVANSTRQRIDEESPLLSASLPSGERIQIVLPPATTPGCVAISIRRPSDQVWTIEELSASGIFRATRRASEALDDTETELLKLLRGAGLRGLHAPGGREPQEHPGLRTHRAPARPPGPRR